MEKKREMGIDIIKCLAIFSVIGVHFILNTATNISMSNNIDIMLYLSYRQFFIVCVPLFILTTGYLSIKNELNVKYFKKIFSILGIYLFYSIITLIYRNTFIKESITLVAGIKMVFSFEAIPYAWYVNMFIGLFFLSPVLNKIIKNCSKKEVELCIFIIIGISIIPSTWNSFNTFLGYSNILPLPNFWISVYPIAYYLIGAYLKVYPSSFSKKYYVYIAISIYITSIFINYMYSSLGSVSNVIKEYSSLFILIQSCSLFMYLLDKDSIKTKFDDSIIKFISSHTLEIYLISYLVDTIIYSMTRVYIFSNTMRDYIYSIPVIVTVFSISVVIVLMVDKTKKIIINIGSKV